MHDWLLGARRAWTTCTYTCTKAAAKPAVEDGEPRDLCRAVPVGTADMTAYHVTLMSYFHNNSALQENMRCFITN